MSEEKTQSDRMKDGDFIGQQLANSLLVQKYVRIIEDLFSNEGNAVNDCICVLNSRLGDISDEGFDTNVGLSFVGSPQALECALIFMGKQNPAFLSAIISAADTLESDVEDENVLFAENAILGALQGMGLKGTKMSDEEVAALKLNLTPCDCDHCQAERERNNKGNINVN